MIDFFVEQLLGGFLLVAFPIAILAGLISFISPCVLPLVPGYLSFAAGYSKSKGRVFLGADSYRRNGRGGEKRLRRDPGRVRPNLAYHGVPRETLCHVYQ